MLPLEFKLERIFQLIDKILEGKVPIPSLQVLQIITKPSIKEDLAKLQVELATKIIFIFDEDYLKEINKNFEPSCEVPLATRVAILFDDVARPT